MTSVHCIAMCGGIHLSQCIPQADQASQNSGKMGTFRPALLYNTGRVISYTAIGFVLGLLGMLIGGSAEIGMGVFLQGILKIAAGVFMVIMGINMLGLFPALRRFTIGMPRILAHRINMEKAKSNRPFYVGILNGLMPCGPLQSMWIVALAAGSPFAGALSMFLFSLGTVPLMLGFGSFVSILSKKFAHRVMTVGAVLVTVLGLAMLSQGGSLSGWLPPDLLLILVIALSAAGVLLGLPVQRKGAKSLLKLAAVVVVQKGIDTVWNIDLDLEDADKQIDLLAPFYSTMLTLESGSNQLYLYPTEDFDVATGDYQAFAYLKVVDDIKNIDEDAIRAEVGEYEPLIYPSDTYAGSGMSCCY